ncbi:SHOCT domain-containing protein [Paradesulfitobacterium aromaticivorans]
MMGFGGHMFGGWGFNPGFYGSNVVNGGPWWVWLIAMGAHLLFWVVLIGVAVYLFRRFSSTAGTRTIAADNAFSLLRERFARGEIDTEEYLRRKQDLS